MAGHYSAHIGLAPSFKLTASQSTLQHGSIIIKNMYHCPVQLLHISPDIPRSCLNFNISFSCSLVFTSI